MPTFIDIDADGDLDLFLGDRSGTITLYRNTGTSVNPCLTLETRNFADIDNDGDPDLFVGELYGGLHFYRGH